MKKPCVSAWKSIAALTAVFCVLGGAIVQNQETSVDLAGLTQSKRLKRINREIAFLKEGEKQFIRLSENPGDGLAILDGITLSTGVIEFEVRGKNILQKSFVGVAFHGADEKTYEAVYFRPFNFKNEDPVRRSHAVQYISHPEFTWPRLRQEKPGMYEKPINPVPDPDGWFRARLVVSKSTVDVFVNGSSKTCLSVDRLTDRTDGWVALWAGNTSGGDFSILKIAKSP